jgi:hypothetical protein
MELEGVNVLSLNNLLLKMIQRTAESVFVATHICYFKIIFLSYCLKISFVKK